MKARKSSEDAGKIRAQLESMGLEELEELSADPAEPVSVRLAAGDELTRRTATWGQDYD